MSGFSYTKISNLPTSPEVLGTSTFTNTSSAPSAATDGFPTNNHRFVNVWLKLVEFTSADLTIYLYSSQNTNWMLYTDVPQTTFTTANGGGVLQLETRGASRIYARVPSVSGNGTGSFSFEGLTY